MTTLVLLLALRLLFFCVCPRNYGNVTILDYRLGKDKALVEEHRISQYDTSECVALPMH